jgi:hypothetical protein
MGRTGFSAGGLALALIAISVASAAAEVRDAVYRGTLVCDKLPFTETRMREAIDVTIAGGTVRYTHVVRLRGEPEAMPERGTGTLRGQDIALEGSWQGQGREYQASYSGTFVRRSAKLRGRQTWTGDGRIVTRACSGVIKRPLRVFLPRDRKKSGTP